MKKAASKVLAVSLLVRLVLSIRKNLAQRFKQNMASDDDIWVPLLPACRGAVGWASLSHA